MRNASVLLTPFGTGQIDFDLHHVDSLLAIVSASCSGASSAVRLEGARTLRLLTSTLQLSAQSKQMAITASRHLLANIDNDALWADVLYALPALCSVYRESILCKLTKFR